MRKLPAYLLFAICYLLLVSPVSAQNKCGVNVGPHYGQAGQTYQLTGRGGWIVALGSPGNCSDFERLFGQGLNVVIRAYNGGRAFTNEQALGWAATLGTMDTQGQMIYFMPWNEPNHSGEGGGSTAGNRIYEFSSYLKNTLNDAGLLGTKVKLLSPMVDKLNPSFINGSFFTNPGGKSGFYSLFDGSSINEYDQFSPGPCSSSVPEQNNCQYDQIGIRSPYYALETGVAGTCSPPCYNSSELRSMLDTSWSKWTNDPNFKMFAIFSYDPHRPGNWNIFNSSEVKSFYSSQCASGNVIQSNFDPDIKFNQWFTEQHGLISCDGCGHVTDEQYCTAAGLPEEPVELELENSKFCTDFVMEYHTSDTSTQTTTVCQDEGGTCMASGICTAEDGTIDGTKGCTSPSICCKGSGGVLGTETYSDEIGGTLELTREDIPDFSKAEERTNFALNNLLPYDLTQQLSIPRDQLETRVKHFVEGSETPEQEPKFKDWLAAFLGGSKISCGIFNTCDAPKSVAIEIEQPDLTEISNRLSANTFCQQTEKIKAEPVPEIETIEAGFSVSAWITKIVDTIRKVIEDIISSITKTTKDATLTNKTRGELPGGITLKEQTEFMTFAIPKENIVKGSPLAAKADYKVTGPYTLTGEGKEKINYHELNQVRAYYCPFLCSFHPYEMVKDGKISEIDELCPSCNSDDYKGPEIEFPECPTPPEECSWYRVNELGEIIPSCIICGNILFCYGNDYRLCPSGPIFPDPTPEGERNTTPAWNTEDPIPADQFPSGTILYNGMNFRVPEGGVYGCDSNVFGCSNDSCDYYQECADI
ncbi:hypothetical protein ISS86_02180 [Candidatus Microgenomates bacterium]|nr:hypothetical protein [Candidatus Microgenomates bacterium]